jgi:predicted dithiol-disulfide oxidoreductase (DUF899 family)
MKKDTRHKEVILAFLEGREVQYQSPEGEWVDYDDPTFLEIYNYRIKPQPKLIPFDFSDAEMLIGRMIKSKDGKIVSVITDLTNIYIWLSNDCKTYNQLLSDYTFLDGTPCGQKN